MQILLDPNIAYLALVAGTLSVLLAVIIPGTGVPEIVAVFAIVFAGYAIYHLGVNWWALVLLLASLAPFFFAVRGPRRELWLGLSIVGLTAGSVFFFPSDVGAISVNPLLAVATTIGYAAVLWLVARKVLQIAQTLPTHELSALIGLTGEAKTAVNDVGSVQIAGELWSARSDCGIPVGSPIRVIGRDGFFLLVEKVGLPESPARKE
jgi:membrane-bound serine protease (ClpP class)